jgi:hypothetical protein
MFRRAGRLWSSRSSRLDRLSGPTRREPRGCWWYLKVHVEVILDFFVRAMDTARRRGLQQDLLAPHPARAVHVAPYDRLTRLEISHHVGVWSPGPLFLLGMPSVTDHDHAVQLAAPGRRLVPLS